MNLMSPIIERSDLQSPQQRTLFGMLTIMFWGFWLYLWLPLLALVAWAVGLEQAYKYMVVLGGYEEVLRLLGVYFLVILLLGGTLTGWATYNIMRYGKRGRRGAAAAPSLEKIALYYKQDHLQVSDWRKAQRMSVTHDEHGNVHIVDVLDIHSPSQA
jgi:biofilm PGA synthesis protein PgaD